MNLLPIRAATAEENQDGMTLSGECLFVFRWKVVLILKHGAEGVSDAEASHAGDMQTFPMLG